MYSQVYIHKTTRAYEALLTNILRLAADIVDGNPDMAPAPCPPALARMLAGQEVSVDEYLALDDFRLWITFIEWSQLQSRNNDHLARLSRMCDKLVNRKQPYKFVELDSREKQDKALELISSLKGSCLRFSCARDAFTDLAYRNARYRKSKEVEEEEDRVIFVLGHDDKAHPVENESLVIDDISKIETQIFRLYYDEDDPAIIQRLKDEGWLQQSATFSQGGRP